MRNLLSIGALVGAAFLTMGAAAGQTPTGKIGIFDLDKIHSVPLDVQIVDKTETDGIVTEKIRFTSSPGIRIFAYMSYPAGKQHLPCNVGILNARAESRKADAREGFVGFSVCAPEGNTNPNIDVTVGGPKNQNLDNFKDNPNDSWIYQHVVAITRGIDYLATRPEVDMKRVLVMGFSWSGYIAALLHAIDDRPCAYVTWNGTGYYADATGMSGDKKSAITRKQYEMYAPSAYAQYGTQPIFIGNSLTDYFATLDGGIAMYNGLKSPKLFAYAPNRYHADTSRHEYLSSGGFMQRYQMGGPAPVQVLNGAFEVKGGKLFYKYFIDGNEAPTRTEVMYSYGPMGHWVGRTWHRIPATLQGTDGYVAEIPVYDPAVPVYAVAQIESKTFRCAGNRPDLFIPKAGGLTAASATFNPTLFDFEDKDDLYFGSGDPQFVQDPAPGEGSWSASVEPFADGTVHLLNIEPFLWKDATGQPFKYIEFWLKGDGQAGEEVNVYFQRDSDYQLDEYSRPRASKVPIVKKGEVFAATWQKFAIPLNVVRNLTQVDSLWFETPGRKLLIDGVRLK